MSTGSVTPTLAALNASRARQESVVRWLRPLVPLIIAVVVYAAFHAHPAPGLSGPGLPVSVALAGFGLAGLGASTTVRRTRKAHIAFVAVLFASSAALVWLQPDGVGVAGLFVGVSLLAPVLREHLSIPAVVVGLVFLGLAVATGRHGSVTSALLNAIMVSAFYGVMFLAIRLGEANRLAERLLVELERSRAAQARAAGLAERQRLAREMHDVLAHSLSGLMLQLEGARLLVAEAPGDPRLPQIINRAHHLGKTGLDEARRAIGTLRDGELPGPQRLSGLVAQFEQDHGVPCQLTVAGQPRQLDSEASLAVYRVAQEALTNITKHAQPERVEVHLAYEPSATRLTVEDFTSNGHRPPPAGGDGAGYGLTGMRERAELLGGQLTAVATDKGFRVELEVPA